MRAAVTSQGCPGRSRCRGLGGRGAASQPGQRGLGAGAHPGPRGGLGPLERNRRTVLAASPAHRLGRTPAVGNSFLGGDVKNARVRLAKPE